MGPSSRDAEGPTGLRLALVVSLALHVAGFGIARCGRGPVRGGAPSLVDIDLAPPAPEAETLPDQLAQARPLEPEPVVPAEPPLPEPGIGDGRDGGVPDGAPPDAAPADARRRRPDAAPADARPLDVPQVAAIDGGVGDAGAATSDASAPMLALLDGGAAGRDGGLVAATGDDGEGAAPALGGSPGDGGLAGSATKANLLAYVPAGHVLALMLRFDRLRGTRWAGPAGALFRSMPDHRTIIGDRDDALADLFDTLVISTPDPSDAAATILVARTSMTRAALRDFLDEPATPVTWTAASGGLHGRRGAGARVRAGDARAYLSPALGWFTLAPVADLPGLLTPATGALDAVVAHAPLPAWLGVVQTIEAESGTTTGPAMIMTLAAAPKRHKVPQLAALLAGIQATSLPAPTRLTMSLEIVAQGFIVRGHATFATDADADEIYALASTVIDAAKARGGVDAASAALTRLSVQPPRARAISYATSLSIRDATAALALAGGLLDDYYAKARVP